jgi:RIO-like serine/threonine protein kinase
MSGEFELVRRTARESWLMRRADALTQVLNAAWRSSITGAAVNTSLKQLSNLAPVARIRWAGTTIAIAALAHLALRSMLSSTVVPALPTLLIAGVAAFSAIVAWQAAAFERAWRQR